MDGSKETKDDRVVYSLFRLFVEVYFIRKNKVKVKLLIVVPRIRVPTYQPVLNRSLKSFNYRAYKLDFTVVQVKKDVKLLEECNVSQELAKDRVAWKLFKKTCLTHANVKNGR